MTARRRVLRMAVALLLGALLLPATAAAQPAAPTPDSVLDSVVAGYRDASAGWLDRLLPLAMRTFALLATLELAVSGLFWALGREGLDAVLAALLRKFIVLSFLFSLLSAFPLWLPVVTQGFEAAGQAGSGTAAVNPAQLLDYGIAIAGRMLAADEQLGILTQPATVLIGAATALIVVLAYALIAVQLCLTLCEVSFVLTGGVLFLGFAGFRVTAPFAEGYLLFSFQTGAKIFLLYLLVGVGTALSQQWAVIDFNVQNGQQPSLTAQFAVMTGALVLAVLAWRAGAIARNLLQSASLHLREGLR